MNIDSPFSHPNYAIAFEYLCLNASLTLTALLFGLGFIFTLRRFYAADEKYLSIGDTAFLAVGSGFAVIIAELFILALINKLYLTPIAVTFSITALFSAGVLLCEYMRHRPPIAIHFSPQFWTTTLFVIFLCALQFSSLSVPELSDSTSFHLPYADVFLKNKGLAVDYHLIYPFMSLNISLFYSLALLLEHDIVFAQSVHALFATLTLFGIYRACLYTKQKIWLALLMPFIFLTVYPVNLGRYTAYADLPSMFFIFSSLFPLFIWHKNRNARWLLLCSATCLGIAMGSKYIMAIFALPIAIYIVLFEKKHFLKPLLIYGGCAALWGLWWHIRNTIYTGNPVHPFATEVFGYSLWDANDMKRQFMALNVAYVPQSILGFALAPVFAFYSPVLMEQDIFAVLLALYATAPLVYFAEKSARHLLLFCFCFVLFWVLTTSDPRYLLPAIPLIFIYAGSVIQGVIIRFNKLAWIRRAYTVFPAHLLSGVLVSCAFAVGFLDIREKIQRVQHIPISREDAHQFLLRENPTYDLIFQANNLFGERGRVFEFYYRDGRWFSHNILLGTQFGEHAYWRILTAAHTDNNGTVHYSPEKLERVLKDNYQADGFIIPNPSYFKNHYRQEEFETVFDLLYQNGDGSIYRIRK